MEEHYKQFGVRAGIPTAMQDAIESSSLKAYDALVKKCIEKNTHTGRIVAEILSLIGQQLSKTFLWSTKLVSMYLLKLINLILSSHGKEKASIKTSYNFNQFCILADII